MREGSSKSVATFFNARTVYDETQLTAEANWFDYPLRPEQIEKSQQTRQGCLAMELLTD